MSWLNQIHNLCTTDTFVLMDTFSELFRCLIWIIATPTGGYIYIHIYDWLFCNLQQVLTLGFNKDKQLFPKENVCSIRGTLTHVGYICPRTILKWYITILDLQYHRFISLDINLQQLQWCASFWNEYHNGCSKTAEILYESLEDEIFNAIGADYCSNFYMLMFQIVFYRREKLMIMYFWKLVVQF